MSVQIDPANGALLDTRNQLTAEPYDLSELIAFEFQVDGTVVNATDMHVADASAERKGRFIFRGQDLEVTVGFIAPPDQHFIEKTLQIKNTGVKPHIIDPIVIWRMQFKKLNAHPHRHPSVYAFLFINVFLNGDKGGLFVGVENPFGELLAASERIEISYRPRWLLGPGETFTSEPGFLGTYRKEGVYAFKELGRLAATIKQGNVPPVTARMDQEVLDWGRGRCRHLSRHPTTAGISPAGVLPAPPSDRWKTRSGQTLRRHHLRHRAHPAHRVEHLGRTDRRRQNGYRHQGDRRESQFRTQRAVAGRGKIHRQSKSLYSGSMETVPHAIQHESRVGCARRDGQPWLDGQTPRACLANPEFIRTYIEAYDRLISEHDLYMVTWDSTAWMWLKWPDPNYECFAENHQHPPGDVRYHVWRQLTHLFAELHRRHPQLAMRIAAGLQPGYPWILKDLIEHHTSFYDNEPGGSWWRSRNELFIPAYKCTSTMAANTWPQLQYNFFRSLSIADHAMLWGVDVSIGRFGLPMDEDQRRFFPQVDDLGG